MQIFYEKNNKGMMKSIVNRNKHKQSKNEFKRWNSHFK